MRNVPVNVPCSRVLKLIFRTRPVDSKRFARSILSKQERNMTRRRACVFRLFFDVVWTHGVMEKLVWPT